MAILNLYRGSQSPGNNGGNTPELFSRVPILLPIFMLAMVPFACSLEQLGHPS
jgi:hypothetical protein